MGVKDYMEEYYSQPYQDLDEDTKRIAMVLEMIGTGKKVLDIGCWDGTISQKIQEHGNEVTGVDLSSGAVAQARKKIKAMQGDVEKGLPFEPASFDIVFMGGIIEQK